MKERALKWLLGKGISLSYTFRFEWTGFNNETKGKTKGEGRDLDVGGNSEGRHDKTQAGPLAVEGKNTKGGTNA